MRKHITKTILTLAMLLACGVQAQSGMPPERLPRDVLDVNPPSLRVSGEPGALRIVDRSCAQYPVTEVRQRIVNIATQEWHWFGASVIDMTSQAELDANEGRSRRWWRDDWMTADEAGRVADDIAGYWAAAPDSSWIVENQNRRWREQGITARWRDFWSAAFISWVMCESGLGRPEQFQRAIAHHTYIDQAIRARDGMEHDAVFTAYDIGEMDIQPGDMLCRGTRPAYRSLEQRREHLGEGARSHCDIVIGMDDSGSKIRVVGGNVRGSVRMKLLPAGADAQGRLVPLPYGDRRLFAHLKLNTAARASGAATAYHGVPEAATGASFSE